MKYGARNQLGGKVKSIKEGSLMSQVEVEIEGDAVFSSVMTLDSLRELDLKPGDKVRAIVKAVNVMLVKED